MERSRRRKRQNRSGRSRILTFGAESGAWHLMSKGSRVKITGTIEDRFGLTTYHFCSRIGIPHNSREASWGRLESSCFSNCGQSPPEMTATLMIPRSLCSSFDISASSDDLLSANVPSKSKTISLFIIFFHFDIVFTLARSPVAFGPVIQGFLSLWHIDFIPVPNLQCGLVDGTRKRK